MTSELIERVARAIADTTDFDGDRIASRYADSELRDIAQSAITAIIEADRKAVRAEQAAELAKLKALAEAVQADAAPVVWQQREKYPQAPGAIPQWRECSRSEAVGHFKKRPDCEYRPLYAHPPVADLAQLRAELEAANEVVAEQLEIRQRNEAELAKYKALAETLAGALDEWVFRYYWRHEGMNTEHARIYAKAQTEMMLRQYKEARDAS